MTSERDAGPPDPADLERTAELPVLRRAEPPSARGRDELGSTDTWIAPRPPDVKALETRLAAESARAAAIAAELERAQSGRGAALRRVSALERELAEVRAALAAADLRIEELSRRAEAAAGSSRPPDPVLEARLVERDRLLESAERRLAELEQQLSAHREALNTVEGRRIVHDALLRGLQSEVSESETRVAELEAEIRAKDSLLDTLRRRSSGHAGALAGDEDPRTVRRELVRLDAAEEEVHALGRKTRIGRTPDNDVRIGARFVSRHHALVLVGRDETIIEDLNSTNGVLVNGRRIARQRLEDGDEIALGQARFRFVMRGIV